MAFNPKTEYTIEPKIYVIKDFHDYPSEFVTRPPYQRKAVWSTKKKQALMDSLIRKYYVPQLVLREVRVSGSNSVSEVIDGQQRITTAVDFFRNEYPLPRSLEDIDPELVGKRYSEISDARFECSIC